MLAVARVAGIQAVKKTSEIIPLAHPGLPIEGCVVRVEPVPSNDDGNTGGETSIIAPSSDMNGESPDSKRTIDQAAQLSKPLGLYGGVRIFVDVETTAKTGVEMEALTGVLGAALTVVDMCKGADKKCVIEGVRVIGKKGGRRGVWGIWGQNEHR